MSLKKKITAIILIIGVLLFFLALWYKHEYSMNKVQGYDLNAPSLSTKLIIATQGSEFKDKITNDILEKYRSDSIFIKIIDVSMLQKINPKDYNAVVVMHTWENWKPPIEVKEFIKRTRDHKEKIIVLTTSGEGSYKMDDVDAITGESKLESTTSYSNKIIERLKPLLKH